MCRVLQLLYVQQSDTISAWSTWRRYPPRRRTARCPHFMSPRVIPRKALGCVSFPSPVPCAPKGPQAGAVLLGTMGPSPLRPTPTPPRLCLSALPFPPDPPNRIPPGSARRHSRYMYSLCRVRFLYKPLPSPGPWTRAVRCPITWVFAPGSCWPLLRHWIMVTPRPDPLDGLHLPLAPDPPPPSLLGVYAPAQRLAKAGLGLVQESLNAQLPYYICSQ